MSFEDVDDVERGAILVCLVEPLKRGRLTPERGSRVASEDEDHGPPLELGKIDFFLPVLGSELQSGRRLSDFRAGSLSRTSLDQKSRREHPDEGLHGGLLRADSTLWKPAERMKDASDHS
jgi:hypothetical protein